MSRAEVFLTTVDFLQRGGSVSVSGEHRSGRTHFLGRVRDHFVTLGWRTVLVSGIEELQRTPLAALALAGLVPWPDQRPLSVLQAFRALDEQVTQPRTTVLLVDDGEWIDEASWTVLTLLSGHCGIPFARTRATHRRSDESPPTGGAGVLYTLRLPAMTYVELEQALEQTMGEKIDPLTMSRVYSKAGGNVGVAIAILEAAGRAGRLKTDGSVRATGSLWSPGLTGLVDVFLRSLAAEEIAALRTLSLLGPAALRTAAGLVSEETIYALEEKRFIDVVETCEGPLVSVSPPLVAEHFRREVLPGRREATLSAIDAVLEAGARDGSSSAAEPGDSALFVRLAHERTRRIALAAREEWRRRPSLRSASALVEALGADSASPVDEVESLLHGVEHLDGSPRERADWAIVYAKHVAHDRGPWREQVTRLRNLAAELPEVAPRLLAEAVLLEIEFDTVPDDDPFAGLDLPRLHDDLLVVVLARAYWMLVRGRVVDAAALLSEHHALDARDPRLHASFVYAKLALGEFSAAAAIAESLAAAARAEFDAPRLRIYEYLTAISSVFTRRFDIAEAAIDSASSLGVPAGCTPSTYVGLSVLSAFFAVQRGQRAVMHQHLAELDAAGLPDGPLPGLHRSFVLTRLALLDGDPRGAGRVGRRAGDELWARGARFAAAFAYLDGLRAHPDRADWEHARPRIDAVDTPAVRRWAAFTRAIVAKDSASIVAAVTEVAGTGETADAASLAGIALLVLDGDETVEQDVIDALTALASADARPSPGQIAELTPRELEVAELIAAGLSNPRIAEVLVLSVRTVESHVHRLIRKIGAASRADVREHLLSSGLL